VASYPADSVGMVRAANEIGLKAQMFWRRHGRPAGDAVKIQLGPLLNGHRQLRFYFPRRRELPACRSLKEVPGAGAERGRHLLGYYLPP